MKKIGKEVLFLPTNNSIVRNGEGALIKLKNNTIMYAYTEYFGESRSDDSPANIVAIFSYDEGESWKDKRIIVTKKADQSNVMSVSLIRFRNGDLGLFYLIYAYCDGYLRATPNVIRSSDDGLTWSNPIPCAPNSNHYILNNDRAVMLKNGRIMLPLADHGKDSKNISPGKVVFAYSDDDGVTWSLLDTIICSTQNDNIQLQEPGIYEFDNGELWVYMRTCYGNQYQSFSKDGGISWETPHSNGYFPSPVSPMKIKKVGDFTVSVFNPYPPNKGEAPSVWGSAVRTPLAIAVSKDDGRSLTYKTINFENFNRNFYYLEDDRSNYYCYPAICEVKDGFLVAYYHSNNTEFSLNSAKITKVLFSELD